MKLNSGMACASTGSAAVEMDYRRKLLAELRELRRTFTGRIKALESELSTGRGKRGRRGMAGDEPSHPLLFEGLQESATAMAASNAKGGHGHAV